MQQTIHRPGTPPGSNKGGSRLQTIIITAVTLFALSGLLVGFTVGAVTAKRTPQKTDTPPPKTGSTVVVPSSTTPTARPTETVVKLGCPDPLPGSSIFQGVLHTPDGTTQYTMTIQARTQGKTSCDYPPTPALKVTGITCKIWLVKHIPEKKNFSIPTSESNKIQHIEQLSQPIKGKVADDDFPEITDALKFDPTTPQTQACNGQGQGTWKYAVAPGLDKDMYSLIFLTDYKGKAVNWSWRNFLVQKG